MRLTKYTIVPPVFLLFVWVLKDTVTQSVSPPYDMEDGGIPSSKEGIPQKKRDDHSDRVYRFIIVPGEDMDQQRFFL